MNVNEAALLATLRQRLGENGVLTEAADRSAYEQSARHAGGVARAVLRPGSEDELAWTIQRLADTETPFVLQGAATGLVGAATPTADRRQYVVSTQRVRDRLEIDPVNRCAKVSAGYRLSDLNRAAVAHGLVFPIDLGADPSIGGMVATNTGGARLIRYGGVRENLLDVRGILLHPAGALVGSERGLRKDNTGLSWAQLLCGTFGALGAVSSATVKLHPIPRQTATALLAVTDVRVAIDLVCDLERAFGEMVSAFEGISGDALDAVRLHQKNVPIPFASMPGYCVLVEVASAIAPGRGFELEPMLMAWLEERLEAGDLSDAVVDKPTQLWRIRHSISEAVQGMGRMVAFDLAVERSRFADFRAQALDQLRLIDASIRACDFGHLGDGAMHFNIVVPATLDADDIRRLRNAIYDLTVRTFDGSYSAEHGLGPYNAIYYERYAPPATRDLAKLLKQRLDPNGLLGNVALV